MYSVCVIGHVTRDVIRINGCVKHLPGGTAYYFPLALKSLGLDVCVVTKIGPNDRYLLNDLYGNNIPIFLTTNEKTTAFENSYVNGLEFRVQRVKSASSPFTIEEIPDISPTLFHVGPLINGDIPLDVLSFLSKKSKISLDVQGYVRSVEHDRVKTDDWHEKKEGLAYVDILKADDIEAKVLSGEEDIKRAAKKLSAFGPKEVIITAGSKGSLIYSEGKSYMFPSFSHGNIVDPTGCGDTYMAGYINMRLRGHTIDESGRFSAGISSLKLQNHGPFRGTKEEVQNLLNKRK